MIFKNGVIAHSVVIEGALVFAVVREGKVAWQRDSFEEKIKTSGPYRLPALGRYYDIIVAGGGASGQTGNGATGVSGRGGNPGGWASATYERGIDFPMDTEFIDILIGSGGAPPPDSDHASANSGGASYVTIPGQTPLMAPGGIGERSGLHNRDGVSMPTHVYNGINYFGGSGGVDGNPSGGVPGGGGRGGAGGYLGNRGLASPGGNGAVWIVSRSIPL